MLSSRLRRLALSLVCSFAFTGFAHAVIVRGRVTTPLGKVVPGARIRMVSSGEVVAVTTSGADGTFEIRTGTAGRFTLLTAEGGFLPAIGEDFYGGASDVVTQDVVISTGTVRQQVTVTATGIPTPLPQLTAPVSVIPEEKFSTRFEVTPEMRLTPGAVMVQTGQTGGVTSLFMRGGNSTANLVLVDGIPADDIGGAFDFGTVSSTGVGRLEMYRGPDSALYGTDAGASVITLNTPRGATLRPLLTYSGDAGNLHTWRNEGALSGTWKKLDYLGAFSRFDTSNALELDRYHAATSVANLGYSFTGNTQVRFTIRNAVSASGLPSAHDFYGISSDAKQADQDLYSGITLENREHDWHNLVRYGIARKREQSKVINDVGTPLTFGLYFGNVMTIRGANGYTATGQASFFLPNEDQDSNRDQLYYQTDYTFSPKIIALFGFRYDNERGSFNDNDFSEHETVSRPNFEYNLQFQGQAWGRFFYSAGGALEKNHLYGIAGTPRIGLGYAPVRPSDKVFHGTKLRANAATGVQEPSLALEYASLYTQLTPDVARQYNVGPPSQQRSRSYDLGVDQNILNERLVLKIDYFHNVFDRQLEGVSGLALAQYFHIPPTGIPIPSIYEAYVNSLAYRASGAELELEWQLKHRLFVRGGYTYLDATVVQSFAGDAVAANQGTPTTNPNLPGIAIGAESPLVGARPFRRPPHSGFFDVDYTRPKYTVAFKGAMASRSDDSTYLDGFDSNFGNTLILPNRDLDFGYAKLDLGTTFNLTSKITMFAQVENLLNNQHIGPIGFPGLPLTVRAGLKFRIGGD